GRIKAVDSNGHLRSCPSDLGGIVRGRVNKSFGRLVGSRRIREGSWNVGSLTHAAKGSLGVASARTHSTHRESWWFCEEVQTKVAMKQSKFKDLLSCSESNQEDIDRAKERDIGNVKYIKDEGGRTIVREEDIRTRWGECFSSLFNETPSKESRPEGSGEVERSSSPAHFDCYYSRINHREVRAALQKMGRNKAVGPDQIPIEA
nr:hypothetical protein [Tanacetum cinerariifolium]